MLINLRLGLTTLLVCLTVAALPGSVSADGSNSIANVPEVTLDVTLSGSTTSLLPAIQNAPPQFWRVNLQTGDQLVVDLSDTGNRSTQIEMYSPDVTDNTLANSPLKAIEGTDGITHKGELRFTASSSGEWIIEISPSGCCGNLNYQMVAYVNRVVPPTVSTPTTTTSTPTPQSKKPAVKPLVVVDGDSFASGEGTQSFPAVGSGCDRTNQAWPNLLPYPSINLACAGAKISALFSSYKGEQPQIQRTKALHPGLVLVMISGNDALYSTALKNCYWPLGSDCVGGGKLNQNFDAIATIPGKLAGALEALAKAVPTAAIDVVGYPRVFPKWPAKIINCGWLNNSERLMLNNLGGKLQDAEMSAVDNANAALALTGNKRIRFISTMDALKGHELCNYNSWMFKIRPPFCVKDSRCGHPTAPGQAAIAAVAKKYLAQQLG